MLQTAEKARKFVNELLELNRFTAGTEKIVDFESRLLEYLDGIGQMQKVLSDHMNHEQQYHWLILIDLRLNPEGACGIQANLIGDISPSASRILGTSIATKSNHNLKMLREIVYHEDGDISPEMKNRFASITPKLVVTYCYNSLPLSIAS